MDREGLLITTGIGMILLGFLLVFIGTLISALGGGEGEVEGGGGVVMIGPIPIIFGTGRGGASMATLLAIVLMVLWIVGALLARRGG